jgi:hypothetical protein
MMFVAERMPSLTEDGERIPIGQAARRRHEERESISG